MIVSVQKDYIISEEFIYDGLITLSERAIEKLYMFWRRDKKIDGSLLVWPAERIRMDDGVPTEGIISMSLPREKAEYLPLVRKCVERTKAYAFLLITQEAQAVRVLLEAPQGTHLWTLPIERSADITFLGKPRLQKDSECIGLIWTPNKGSA